MERWNSNLSRDTTWSSVVCSPTQNNNRERLLIYHVMLLTLLHVTWLPKSKISPPISKVWTQYKTLVYDCSTRNTLKAGNCFGWACNSEMLEVVMSSEMSLYSLCIQVTWYLDPSSLSQEIVHLTSTALQWWGTQYILRMPSLLVADSDDHKVLHWTKLQNHDSVINRKCCTSEVSKRVIIWKRN